VEVAGMTTEIITPADDLLLRELREPAATVNARRLRYRVAASPNPSFTHAIVDTADHDRPLAFYNTHALALARAARWNEKGHPAAARVEGQREPPARSPELLGATQGATPHHDTTGDANAALAAPTPAGDDGKGSLVVTLPDGWRVIATLLQWIVEAGQKSGGACHPGEAKRPRKGRSVIGALLPEHEDIPQFNDAATADTLEAI
jgi:hypothetical protein